MELGYYNMDCLELMRTLPDKCIDLAICDPPYGDGGTDLKRSDKSRFGGHFDNYKNEGGGRTYRR